MTSVKQKKTQILNKPSMFSNISFSTNQCCAALIINLGGFFLDETLLSLRLHAWISSNIGVSYSCHLIQIDTSCYCGSLFLITSVWTRIKQTYCLAEYVFSCSVSNPLTICRISKTNIALEGWFFSLTHHKASTWILSWMLLQLFCWW